MRRRHALGFAALLPLALTASCTSILGDFSVSSTATPGADGGGGDGALGDTGGGSDALADQNGTDGPPPNVYQATPVQVTAGNSHTCAIVNYKRIQPPDDRTILFCWGDAGQGKLGDNVVVPFRTPKLTDPNLTAQPKPVAVSSSAQSNFTCALDDANNVWCWGDNQLFQLGRNEAVSFREKPARVQSAQTGNPVLAARAVSVGGAHACALTSAGRAAVCWGANDKCQCTVRIQQVTPAACQVPQGFATSGDGLGNATGYDMLSAGSSHVCGGTAGASAFCWAANDVRQTSFNEGSGVIDPPTKVLTNNTPIPLSAIAAGDRYTIGIDAQGSLWGWGTNNNAQAWPDDVNFTNMIYPTRWGSTAAQPFIPVERIAAGNDTSCLIPGQTAPQKGNVICWGGNFHGQLGIGRATGAPVPPGGAAQKISQATGVAVGGSHVCAIGVDASVTGARPTIFCWGNNGAGQVNGTPGGDVVAPAVVPLPAGPP